VRTARLPADDLPPLSRSVAACLAAILELETDEVPAPPADHPEPWTAWRTWLATRGLGLVPIERPREFAWPGAWIALLSGDRAAVAYGSPPGGLAWAPLGGSFDEVEAGYVIARHHLIASPEKGREQGTVEVIAVAPQAEAPMELVDHAAAHAGRGLDGDRYADHAGTFSNPHSNGHDLTLIEAEVVDELGLPPEEARRNVVTRGIDLNALVGKRFRVGEAECVGRRLCEPCAHLQRLTHPGILRDLVHRGGLRADILGDGAIRVGDEILSELEPEPPRPTP
jgi:MOSC domain-containing protein YiiM